MSCCRSGVPFGAPMTICKRPVMTAAEAKALNLGYKAPRWCVKHGEQLARVKAALMTTRKGEKTPVPPAPMTVRHIEPTVNVAVAQPVEKLPKAVRALRLAHAVHAHGVLTRAEAAEAAGISVKSLGKIAAVARERGWIAGRVGPGGYATGAVEPPDELPQAA